MEKEKKVYGIDVFNGDDFSEVGPGEWNSMSDEWWMEVAERQGLVWSLEGFQKDFNEENVNTDSMYIRII